ncbi:hypothetical protein NBRC116188_13190 [Oceaniserpentilla sp. 4NH20-0058]|uniref:hypothetical protein n=1 Tax=Oceaniserpentilla sp. 4NH20-0058 TaxID=3127660 RepID=UPI00310C5861
MQTLRSRIQQFFIILTTICMVALPMHSQAEEIIESPSGTEMVLDFIIVRPLSIAATLIGSVIWVASLPFSLLGGNAGEAADVLILTPGKAAFLKCLGCNVSGRKIEYEDE